MSANVLASLLGLMGKQGPDLAKMMPELADITTQASQLKAIEGNIAALPKAEELASGVNKFNFDELQKMYQAAVPGYDEMMKTGGTQINSMLKGELPLDVQRSIQRSRGAKSFAGGYGGSPMAGGAEAQSLGLASLDLIREGLSSSERWLASASSRLPHLSDATSMFISPMQQYSADINERNTQWNRLWAKRQLEAQPTAKEQAAIGLLDWVENIGASAATMGIGGAMGGSPGAGSGGSGGGGMGSLMSMFGGSGSNGTNGFAQYPSY